DYAKQMRAKVKVTLARYPEQQSGVHAEMLDWWIRNKKLKECLQCKKLFRARNGWRVYCSEKCKDAAYWKRRPVKTCQGCGEKYRGTRVWCSDRCWAKTRYHSTPFCARCHETIKPGAEAVLPMPNTQMPVTSGRAIKVSTLFCSERCRD